MKPIIINRLVQLARDHNERRIGTLSNVLKARVTLLSRLGELIEMRRKYLCYSRRKLAAKTGFSESQIERIEAGSKENLKLREVILIALMLDCDPRIILEPNVHGDDG